MTIAQGEGAVTDSHKGTGTEAESAPGKGRVRHQRGTRRSGCGLSLTTGLGRSEGLVRSWKWEPSLAWLPWQVGKREGFWPGCSSWLAAMVEKQIHLGTLRKSLEGPPGWGISYAHS